MNSRRTALLAVAAMLVAWPLVVGAQRPARAHRVGVLLYGKSTRVPAELLQGLRDLGYVEGRDIEFEVRTVAGELGRFSELGNELLRARIDLLVTTNTRAAQAVAEITKTVPIVVIGSGDLVGTGLAASLARPGGNVTGLTALSPELSAKRLELLKEVVPGLKRVAVLWNPEGPAPVRAFKETEAASRLLALEIVSLEVRMPRDFEPAFTALARERSQGLLVITDPLTAGNIATIVKLASERRVPAVFPARAYVDVGGLLAYGPDAREMYRRSAHYVDRILKGAKPSELPIEQPTKFELAINSRTAKALGLSIPRSVLSKADAVVE